MIDFGFGIWKMPTYSPGPTGGNNVKQGIPESPDHLYHFQDLTKQESFQEKILVQRIEVFGCDVRYNKIIYRAGGVIVGELTKEQYEAEKEKLGGK